MHTTGAEAAGIGHMPLDLHVLSLPGYVNVHCPFPSAQLGQALELARLLAGYSDSCCSLTGVGLAGVMASTLLLQA